MLQGQVWGKNESEWIGKVDISTVGEAWVTINSNLLQASYIWRICVSSMFSTVVTLISAFAVPHGGGGGAEEGRRGGGGGKTQ